MVELSGARRRAKKGRLEWRETEVDWRVRQVDIQVEIWVGLRGRRVGVVGEVDVRGEGLLGRRLFILRCELRRS
jgi:hypothetical protein